MVLLANWRWEEVEAELPKIRNSIHAWISIDRLLIEFEASVSEYEEALAKKALKIAGNKEKDRNELRRLGEFLIQSGEILSNRHIEQIVKSCPEKRLSHQKQRNCAGWL